MAQKWCESDTGRHDDWELGASPARRSRARKRSVLGWFGVL